MEEIEEVSSSCFRMPVQPVTPEEREAIISFALRTEKILSQSVPPAEVYVLRKVDIHGISETVGAFRHLAAAKCWYREPLEWRVASAHSWDAVSGQYAYEIERLEVK